MDKLRLKHLREDQKENLCKFWKNHCYQCPLNFQLFGRHYCYKEIVNITRIIGEFWNKELNEKETNVDNGEFIKYYTEENKE